MNQSDENLIEDLSIESIEIALKIKDDFISRYDSNPANILKADQLKKRLMAGPAYAFFQRQQADETRNRSIHKIIVPLEATKAVEFKVVLSEDRLDQFNRAYSYFVLKCKEIPIFKTPKKNVLRKLCRFSFLEPNKKGTARSEDFETLFKEVEALQLPSVDVNKERDQQIWSNYVFALKQLVKQKEHIWKIKKVSKPYFETDEGESNRKTYLDIFINEKDLVAQLQNDILSLFKEEELDDYSFADEKAFIEFNTYREYISQEESSKLNEIGKKLFYQVSDASPMHTIEGDITFKFSQEGFRQQTIDALNDELNAGYQLPKAVSDDGDIHLHPDHITHLQKVVSDRYKDLLSINKDCTIPLKVSFDDEKRAVEDLARKIKRTLDAEGLYFASVYPAKDGENIIVEISYYIRPEKFSAENLSFTKSISRFTPEGNVELKSVAGFEIFNGSYHIVNLQFREVEQVQDELKRLYPDTVFVRKPTLYFFALPPEDSLNKRRDFKTKTDFKGKTEFIVPTSVLKITAENQESYQDELIRIKRLFPEAIIEQKPWSATYSLQFGADSEPYRQRIINKVKDELKAKIGGAVVFDTTRNFSRLLLSYTFQSEDQREKFKTALRSAIEPYKDVLSLMLENELGKTRYEFFKSDVLETAREKELIGDIKQATFIYITGDQMRDKDEAAERPGNDTFRGSVEIGTLVRKDRDRLKFRLNEEFENAKEADRIDLDRLWEGYIKPIFPGELTNINRMLRAMKKITMPGASAGYAVNMNLPNFIFDPAEARESTADLNEVRNLVAANLNEPLLAGQPKQMEAVTKALVAPDMALIQGPPGTGKTTVIAEIIWQVLSQDPAARILITSQTNLAVDNALERLAGKKRVRPVRIGKIDKFENEGKVYSNDRIKMWLNAKDAREEANHADNAIKEWIGNIKDKCSTEEKFSKAISKWKAGLDKHDMGLKQAFGRAYYRYVNVLAATCSECGSRSFGELYHEMFQYGSDRPAEAEFDMVIMDEASKATPPELVLPLTLGRRVIIIGDHKQLPPMMDEQEFSEALEAVGAKNLIEYWTKEDYKISQFEKLFKNAPKSIVASLDTQFRMHEQIMNCISQFYTDQPELENGLICGIRNQMDIPDFKVKASRWHGMKHLPFIDTGHHAIWINVESPERRVGTSFENEGELEAIRLVLHLIKRSSGFEEYYHSFSKDEEKEIGIITYYMPQMQRIRELLYPDFNKQDWRQFENLKFENSFGIPFRINTVDRFQGMERNIVIVSTVRSNRQIREENGRRTIVDNKTYPFALGFARQLQRVNVGFSRAKRLLIVVGNREHFSQKTEYAEAVSKMHKIDLTQLQNLAAE